MDTALLVVLVQCYNPLSIERDSGYFVIGQGVKDMGVPVDIVDLITDQNEDTATSFCHFIKEIFACPKLDIITFCEKLEISDLIETRNQLYQKMCEQQPNYHGQQLRRRRKKKMLIEDIYILGNCTVNSLEDKKLRSILTDDNKSSQQDSIVSVNSDSETCENNTLDLDLFETCIRLKSSVTELMKTVKSLESRIETMESEATRMKLTIANLKDRKQSETVFSESIDSQSTQNPNTKVIRAEVHKDINSHNQ